MMLKNAYAVIKDVINNQHLSFDARVDLVKRINLAEGCYTKDAHGDIQVDPIFNSSSINSTYISNFNPNYKYIILYSTPNENLEKDVTAQVFDIVKVLKKMLKEVLIEILMQQKLSK